MGKSSGTGKASSSGGGGLSAEDRVLNAVTRLNATTGSPIHTMAEARAASGLGKDAFDKAALSLSASGKIGMHFDDAATMRSAEKRAQMVRKGDHYFHAIFTPRRT